MMKKFNGFPLLLSAILLTGTLLSCTHPGPELQTEADSASYAYGVLLANALRNQELDKVIDLDLVRKAMGDVLSGRNDTFEDYEAREIMSTFFESTRARQTMEKYGDNLKAGQEFLKKNAKKEGVVTTESGLQYKVIREGKGPRPDGDDIVYVNYRGTLIDGTEFDASGEDPSVFEPKNMIPGWTEALQLMPEGSKWIVYIPQELAYGNGERAGGKIKPFSALVFEIELVKVDPR